VAHDGACVGQRLLELIILVVDVRPLRQHGLVAEARMLVDEDVSELALVERPRDGLD